LRRKDWAAAAQHYEDALAINPLNHDAWFALGYAYLKINQDQKALKVRSRVWYLCAG
jgi:tetratricopeptide (TPR) repeat protein